ncbi:MAG: hypothetical protein IH957_02595 [Chloroflexi bacterium]|nr:hypothetical protein [Chloroflexota bacterium]
MTLVSEPEPRIVGPWRKPVQMLAEQDIGGRASIHDEETARKAGFTGGAIEGPTHFSQLVPLGHELFGDAWHERGCISAHYQNACVEGDEVQAWAEQDPDGDNRARAGMQKRDGTPVLSATLSIGPDHPETELDALLARLRPADQLVILRDMKIGAKGAEVERVQMGFDQHMGKLYPFTLEEKLAVITESCQYYTKEGGAASPWGRPIVPFEMISVLTQYSSAQARFPVRQPVVGLFANQEIRLLDGPLFVGDEYLLEREVVALSESRRAESSWVRTSVREAKSERLVATTLLNSAVLKASYANYEEERAGLA